MCRWFAYVSPGEPQLLEDLLINPTNSLSKQVHDHYLPQLLPHDPHTLDAKTDKLAAARNSLYNLDGLGVAWYTGGQEDFHSTKNGPRPALYKTMSPPINDFNIRSLAANTASKAVFAHIRATSGSVVQQVNCHPFAFGRHVFMHNGVLANFGAMRRDLSDLMGADEYGNINGGTDSEHLAALYVTFLTDGGGASKWEVDYPIEAMGNALVKTLTTALELQKKLVPEADRAPSSLNLAATDGRQMVAVRFRNCAGEEPPSLYWSKSAGVALNRKFEGKPDEQSDGMVGDKKAEEHGTHFIVASEPTTYDETAWALIPKNTLVMVDHEGDMGTRTVEYDAALDAKDPNA